MQFQPLVPPTQIIKHLGFDYYLWHPYSSDPLVLADHVRQMQAAGADFALCSWWGPDDPSDDNFRILLAVAETLNFKLGILFETMTSAAGDARLAETISAWLSYLHTEYASSPAFFHLQELPVVYLFMSNLVPDYQWDEILITLTAAHQDFCLLGENYTFANLQRFRGGNTYNIAVLDQTGVLPTVYRHARVLTRNYHINHPEADPKILCLPVGGKYDDTDIIPARPAPLAWGDETGTKYSEIWAEALEHHPDLIRVFTANEGPESSGILLDQVETRTLTFSADLITGNVFTATVKTGSASIPHSSVEITVPFNTDNDTTLADLAAALAACDNVVSVTPSGAAGHQHVLTIIAVPYIAMELLYLIILNPLVTGGATQATATQTNIFLDLTKTNADLWATMP